MLPSMTPLFAFYVMGAHSTSVFALSAGAVTIVHIVKASEPVFVAVVAPFVCKK
jgi:solute carrier family 35 protein E1